MAVKVKAHPKFRVLYNLPDNVDLAVLIGGRGGMKTYEASKFAAFDATIRERRVAVLRDEKANIRESILNEIFARYDSANKYGHFNGIFTKNESGIRKCENGEMMAFTKGFRASSNMKEAHLKGISDVDTALIEEAEDIRDPKKFNTFVDSIRTKRRLIIVILNTPDIQHWIVRRYFILAPATLADVPELTHITEKDLEGYWKIIPKQNIPGFLCIQTNYTDNEHLTENVIRSYQAYGDPNCPEYDLHYYLTAIKGFASSGRKGQILRNVQPITLADYLALPFKEVYGQDFGTASPAGTVGVKMDGNNLYARQLNYKGMDILGLAKMYCDLKLDQQNDLLIADSAEPQSIGKLRRGWKIAELSPEDAKRYPGLLKGWHIRGVVKYPGSVGFGLSMLRGLRLFFVQESEDLWNETYNYVYEQNKSGEYTNEPIDDFNHLIDPIRYIAQSRGRYF